MTIPTLIDKQDNFEVIRDQIAAILASEITNQMALATAAAKDPNDWKLRIYTERSNPFEEYLAPVDTSPIVNVWFDNSTFEKSSSNSIERQTSQSIFNIDCYGYGISSDNVAGGHNPGDKVAAFEVQKAVRLVRNILMAGEYRYLLFQGLVGSMWPQSITAFQPQIGDQAIQNVLGVRIAFNVQFNEFSPQMVEETLEYMAIDITRQSDGLIIAEVDIDYTV